MRLKLEDEEPLVDPWEAVAATVRGVLEERTGHREQTRIRRMTLRDWAALVPETRGPLDFDRFAWQRELYDEHAATDREMVFMKATQIGMCLDPVTRVLTADLRWIPLGDVAVGDALVGVDESIAVGKGQRRHLGVATVRQRWETYRPAFRLVLNDGRSVIASADHRFLATRCRRPQKRVRWLKVADMKPGDQIRHVVRPWDAATIDDGWFGGMLDGEGSLRRRHTSGGTELVIAQRFGPVLDRVQRHLDRRGIPYKLAESERPNGQSVGHVRVTSLADIITLVGRSRPTRWEGSWWEAAGMPGVGDSWPRIEAIEPLGPRPLIDIETSTGTFLAEGLVSHNSTQAIRWLLYHADVHQRTCLYTFPTDRELSAFSRQRIRPVIRASDWLRDRMRGDGVDNVEQKQIGFDGWAYFRGTNKPIDSIPADVVVFDEYDTSDQANIEASERRVTGPDSAGLIRRVGVQSLPGWGISALYDGSDQRVWTAKCSAGHWNPMRGYEAFAANVDQDDLILRCSTCRKPLDVRQGEWVATFPDRDVRGYHVNKLMVPGTSLALLVANSRKTRPDQVEAFHTRDLGKPYAPAEGRLSIEQVQACVRPELRPQESIISYNLVTMGVDVASARALNVVIEEVLDGDTTTGRKLWVGTVDDTSERTAFQELCRLMDAYTVNMCGIDNEPLGRWSKAFAARFPGRVFRMDFFTPQSSQKEPPVWRVDEPAGFCGLWRTKVYDAVFERFRMQRVLLPPLDFLPADYAQQLGNLYRRRVELPGDTGRSRVDYVRTGPEDYAQAEAYNLAAIELFYRREGLRDVLSEGPRPLADDIPDFEPLDLTSYGVIPGSA